MSRLLSSIFDLSPYTSTLERDRARVVYGITAFVGALYTIFLFLGDPTPLQRASEDLRWAFQLALFYLFAFLTFWGMRKGYLKWAAAGPVVMWFFGAVVNSSVQNADLYAADGITLVALVLLAGLLTDDFGLVIATGVAIVSMGIGIFVMRDHVDIARPLDLDNTYDAIILTMQLIGSAGVTHLFLRYARFNRQQGLAQAAEERFQLARITTEVAQRISRRIAVDDVLTEAVEQIRSNYPSVYHVQIFLVNADRIAELVASTGDVGKLLIERHHQLKVGDKSVIGQVTHSGKPVLARSNDPGGVHRRNELLPDTVEEAAFPLRVGDQVIGALDMQSKQTNAFPSEDYPIFQSLADTLAIAIENARLYQAEQRRRHIAAALADLAQAINSILELNEIMAVALDRLQLVIPFDSSSILLLEGEHLTIAACHGFDKPDTVVGTVFKTNESRLIDRVMTTKTTIIIADAQNDPDWAHHREEVEGTLSIRAWMGVPLVVHGKSIGMLTLDKHEANFYTSEDAENSAAFASQIATAIQNANLYRAEQRRVREAEILQQAGAIVASSLEQDKTIDLLFEQLARVLPYDSASVQLLRDGYLEIVGGRGWDDRESIIGVRFEVPGDNPNTEVIQDRKPRIINNTSEASYSDLHERLPEYFQAWMGVPLIVQDKTIGMISIDSSRSGYFNEEMLRLVSAFADQVAIAIYNAGLYQQTLAYAEEMSLARHAAEAANRSKSTFLANMSHELRTPLNAIIGYTDLLLSGIYGEITDQQRDRMRRVIENGQHLLGLINDVLDLSKIEAGKMEVYLETFELNDMLNSVVTAVRPLVEKNNNTFIAQYPPALGTMHSDITKVRQILMNLLSNAAKFTEEGQVTLEVSVSGDQQKLYFKVTDSGIGIPPEHVEKLFQEFTQVDPSTTRKFGGTGLGLAITRRYCWILGGDVFVDSELGEGSTFRVELPRQVSSSKPETERRLAAETQETAPTPSQNIVLVIDDDPTVAEVMKVYLKDDGFRVVKATNGRDGLRLAKELRPNLITLDVVMPEMDGWTVLGSLKADPDLAHIPVILLTIMDDRNTGYALGASDYLVKPMQRMQLVNVLKKYSCAQPPCPVLLIEDEDSIRQLMRDALEAEGWAVTEAENGRVGLEKIAENRPTLILLDLMMPEMDGFQFMHELRQHREWRTIPVVIVTAMDLTPEQRKELNGQVQQILQKGAYSREALLDEVKNRVRSSVRPSAH